MSVKIAFFIYKGATMNSFTRYEVSDHLAVELARKYAEELGEPFSVIVGSYPGYDIISQSHDVKIEIKCETTPIRTGNVAIEIYNRVLQRPSGIESTEANLWLHLVLTPEGFIAIEYTVEKLKDVINKYGIKTYCSYNSTCMLVPLDTFKKLSQRVFPFETKFYNELTGE
jgi:hypothetical protein